MGEKTESKKQKTELKKQKHFFIGKNKIKIENEIEENKFLTDRVKDSFVRERAQVCLAWYIRKALKNKYYFYILSGLAIVAPAMAEVVLLCPMDEHYTKIIVGIFVGIASVSTAFLSLFDVRNKWWIYRNQAEILKSMLATSANIDNERDRVLLLALEKSMLETHGMWMEMFKKEKKDS